MGTNPRERKTTHYSKRVCTYIDQVWVLCKAITLETFKMWSLKAIITTIHPCQTCVCMRAFAISRPENYKMKNGNRSARNCTKQNIHRNEFLPGRYTDLTFEAESGSIHSAPNHESQDFFRGFHL